MYSNHYSAKQYLRFVVEVVKHYVVSTLLVEARSVVSCSRSMAPGLFRMLACSSCLSNYWWQHQQHA